MKNETFISVDIEASGPVPGEFSMLSLGACVVGATAENFYVELKPLSKRFDPEALAVAGFDLKHLTRTGVEPARAMQQFDVWIDHVKPFDSAAVFCAYPLAFDWMFVAYYFHRFLKRNPFGYSGFDYNSYFMGLTGKSWHESSVKNHFGGKDELNHNALQDAIVQAKWLEQLFALAHEQRK